MSIPTLFTALLLILDPITYTSGFYAQPEAVHFLDSPSDILTCEGCGPVELRCTIPRQKTAATDLPQPTLHWTINGISIVVESNPDAQAQTVVDATTITSTLTLLRPQLSQSGLYRCVASDGAQNTHCNNLACVPGVSLSNSARVQVLAINVSTETVYSTDCSTTVLSCGVKILPPANARVSLKWMKDLLELKTMEDQQILSNGDLLVHNHGNSNITHTYTCIAEFQDIQAAHHNVTVAQYELTPISIANNTVRVIKHKSVYLEGDTIELVCAYTQLAINKTSCSYPQLTWHINGALRNSTPHNSSHCLRLESAALFDVGRYCCRVDFGDDQTSQDCAQISIVEKPLTELTFPTRYVEMSESTIELVTSYHMIHDSLIWFHNGLQLEHYDGNSSLVLTSSVTANLYGIYQCFLTLEAGGVQTQVLLTRYMPYGLANPPGKPVLSSAPRRSPQYTMSAVNVQWDSPIYSSGQTALLFNIYDRFIGLLSQNITGNSTVVILELFDYYNIYVTVVSSENDGSISEHSLITDFYNDGICSDSVLYPPVLSLTCQGGHVTVSWEDNPQNSGWGGRVFYLAGGCVFQNKTVFLPPGYSTSPTTLNPVMEVGTPCAFEGATASEDFNDYRGDDRYCYDPQLLEYTEPVRCNVTASVQFGQVEYTVQEDTSFVEVCVSAQGYGFFISVATLTSTAVAVEDYEPINQQLEFIVASEVPVSQCINVSISEDELAEEEEVFHIVLSAEDPHVVISSSLARITIIDNDYVNVSMSHHSYTSLENNSSVLVCLGVTGNLRKDIAIRLDTTNGTAIEGSDFVGLHTEVYLNATITTTCITITIIEDITLEETESFLVTLNTSEPRIKITTDSVNINILDNDYISVTFTQSAMMVVHENESSLEVCIAILGVLERVTSVSIATSPITAAEGDDYAELHRNIFLNATNTTFCVDVTVFDDTILENSEQFNLVLISTEPDTHVVGEMFTVQISDDDYVEVIFSNPRIDVQWPDETFNVCIQASGGRMDRAVVIRLSVLSDNPSVLSQFQYEPFVNVYQPGQNVCTSVRIVLNDTESLEVDFIISSEDPGVLFPASNQPTHVVFTGEIPKEQMLNIAGSATIGVLVCVSIVLVCATLLILGMTVVWKHHIKLSYERQMRFGLAKTDTSISDFQDPVSVDPDPLYSYEFHSDDDVTIYNEFFPCGTPDHQVSASSTSIDKLGSRRDLSQTEVHFPQVEVTSQQIMEHLQRHSLVSDDFQKESSHCEYTHCLESESQRKLSQGYGSAFSGHSSSPYVHFDQCNCRCRDCSAHREGKLSDYPTTQDMEEQQDQQVEEEIDKNTPHQCVSSPSSAYSLPV